MIEDVLALAQKEMKEGGNKKEIWGISNDGPQIRKYLESIGITWADQWCAAFVYFCINEICKKKNIKNYYIKTGYCPDFARWGKANKVYSYEPERGDIFLLTDSHPTDPWFHTGFVLEKTSSASIKTIEGNTNDGGSSNGDGIYIRTRLLSNIVFIKWWQLFPADIGTPILFEGKEICKGYKKDGSTFVPIRELCEAMGYNVIWTNKNIVIQKGVKYNGTGSD
jgi:hypothetical protein